MTLHWRSIRSGLPTRPLRRTPSANDAPVTIGGWGRCSAQCSRALTLLRPGGSSGHRRRERARDLAQWHSVAIPAATGHGRPCAASATRAVQEWARVPARPDVRSADHPGSAGLLVGSGNLGPRRPLRAQARIVGCFERLGTAAGSRAAWRSRGVRSIPIVSRSDSSENTKRSRSPRASSATSTSQRG